MPPLPAPTSSATTRRSAAISAGTVELEMIEIALIETKWFLRSGLGLGLGLGSGSGLGLVSGLG